MSMKHYELGISLMFYDLQLFSVFFNNGILETVIGNKMINRSLFFDTHRKIIVYVFTYRKCMLDLVSALIYIYLFKQFKSQNGLNCSKGLFGCLILLYRMAESTIR